MILRKKTYHLLMVWTSMTEDHNSAAKVVSKGKCSKFFTQYQLKLF